MIKSLEVPLKDAVEMFEFLRDFLRDNKLEHLLEDENYLFRISPCGLAEIGYKSDAWYVSH